MRTVKLKDILPENVTPRLARSRLRKAYEEAATRVLPKRVANDWEFPEKDKAKVLRIIAK